MVGHDQHCDAIPDMKAQLLDQLVDLAFEARGNIVDRGEQEARHFSALWATATWLVH